LTEAERAKILALGEDLPRVWDAATTTVAQRKQIVRLAIQEVVVDQRRDRGRVWLKIVWQTGAVSEHWLQRRVQAYAQHADLERVERRVRALRDAGKMDAEIAAILNSEGFVTARGAPFSGDVVHLLRKRWGIPTAKINGTGYNPPRWPDGSYSVQGVSEVLGITVQTVFKWLRKGRLEGRQLVKGQPWQIALSDQQLVELQSRVRQTRRPTMEAS
jgi:hypothetical protein